MADPRLIVFSSLFPSAAAPTAGLFIWERMRRVARHLPLTVIAPRPWSPVDSIIRRWRPHFRPQGAPHEIRDGIEIFRPRYLSVPGIGKRLDGWLMAACTYRCLKHVRDRTRAAAIDAHFLYPDGYAATLLGRWLNLPVAITLRGSKDQLLIGTNREPFLREAMQAAVRLFSVSEALRQEVGVRLGIAATKFTVIGNGVDLDRFQPADRQQARARLGIAADVPVLIGVGNLIPGKGFQRVIPLLPALRAAHPGLIYLIVGGDGAQGSNQDELRLMAQDLGISDAVRFCGRQSPDDMRWFYSAADVFVLATANEGWANVFLEAMACGLPIVTTRVGGNAQVVSSPELGTLVDFWQPEEFSRAISDALIRPWNRKKLLEYAASNTWDHRIGPLVAELRSLALLGTKSSIGRSGRGTDACTTHETGFKE